MKDETYKRIRTDRVLRRKIADALGVESEAVYRQASRKSAKLSKPLIKGYIATLLNKKVEEL